MSVSGSALTLPPHNQCREGQKNTSQGGGGQDTPLTKLTGGSDSDRQGQTMKPPSDPLPIRGQYVCVCVSECVCCSLSPTHTHRAFTPTSQTARPPKDTHIHKQCLSLSLSHPPSFALSKAQWSGVTHVWCRISHRFLSLSGETKLAFLSAPHSSIYKQ